MKKMTNLTDQTIAPKCGCGGTMIIQTEMEQYFARIHGSNALLLNCDKCKISNIYNVIDYDQTN